MDPTTRARARLWLRSEAALGQEALPLRKPQRADAEKTEKSAAPVVKGEKSAPVPAEKPASKSSIALQQAPGAASIDLFVASDSPAALPPLPREEKTRLLAELEEQQVRICPKCRLAETRTQTVFGEGDVDAPIFFIGEGPGETEDKTGRPFVGRAGQLLDQMIVAMGLKRGQVYIANIVKCRPPGNRAPAPDEVETCTPYLVRQIEIIRPKVIVTLGLPAAKYMLSSNWAPNRDPSRLGTLTMGRLRGQWHEWRGIKLMPTFHPAFLLRSYTVENRQAVWSDLQKVMDEIGLKGRKRKVEEPV
ncbi:MAG TPA: uracil-DNA glycosylase [Tepidisphaeraceae bacterium]|nr:uracil-DNA glycosylase [Tepidisphaeraceae bacterium]